MLYIEAKDNLAIWSFISTGVEYRYAAACYIDKYQRYTMLDAFCKLFGGMDSTKWNFYWNSTNYLAQYEFMVFTQDLDWQVMNRLMGDIIPDTIFRIFTNTELLASDAD